MNERIDDNSSNPNQAEEWLQVAIDEENRRRQEQLEGRLKDIDERVERGSMTAEQAQATKEKMMALERAKLEAAAKAKLEAAAKAELETAASAPNQAPGSQSESLAEDKEFAKFQVASGISKEAEFKRLTGEDWPGVEYYATCYGVDEGYDEPIENWTIYKRSSSEQAPADAPEGEDNPEGENNPNGEKDPNGKDDPKGEGDPDDNKNKVDLGDPTVKKLEIAIDEDKAERLKEIEDKLEKTLPELAELYARNRRIFVGAKNRADFVRVKGEYAKLLDEALKLKSEAKFNAGMGDLSEKLEKRADELTQQVQEQLLEFVGGNPENTEKTQEEVDAERKRLIEEAEKTLRAEYGDMTKELETNVNADFLSNYLEEAAKLEDATIDALDNGTACRRFVNKVLNNKVLKGAIIVAGVAGLAATGVGLGMGLAAGTMSVSLGYTAGGVALGAGKGALMGTLMSRQNSKNSAVRGFVSEEELKSQLESINNEDENAASLADWLLDQYSGAKDQDLASNRKRTALSAGIGAVLGGLMSGVHISNLESHEVTERVQVGNEPDRLKIDLFDNVDVAKGGGMYDSYTQMGGDPSKLQQALYIAHNIDAKYGMVPGSNGVTTGFNGQVGEFAHTYPGPISEWPSVAQSYMEEVAEAWARAGLIPSHTVAGGPIYDTITRVVIEQVPNAFMNFLARATATIGAGAIGGIIGGAGQERSRINVETPEASPSTPEASPSTPETTSDSPTADDINELLEKIRQAPEPEASPSTPETTSDSPTADDINELLENIRQAPEPEIPETPEAPENRPSLPDFIAEGFGDRVGETGVEIMTSEEGLNEINSARIAEWWNTLDEDTKREVVDYETTLRGSNYGRALKTWLEINPQDNNPNA